MEPLKTETPNRDVYLWFFEFPNNFRNIGYEHEFRINRANTIDETFREKSEIKWMPYSDILNSKCVSERFKKNLITFVKGLDK